MPLHLSTLDTARFWSKVNKNGPIPAHRPDLGACWVWIAGCANGYGIFSVKDRSYHAHRISWMIAYGPIPDGQWVLHHCDNPSCVNPTHFFPGDAKKNVHDMMKKDRHAHGDTSGTRKHPEKCIHYGNDNHAPRVLTESDVLDIRRRFAAGGVLMKDLATEYAVTHQNIWCVIRRKSWAWLPDDAPPIQQLRLEVQR